MKDIKVSVIIPVYNAQLFLDECLNSIVKQSLKEIEIFIINDGSTDDSQAIIQKFALVDTRIKVLNQTNKGQAKTRNEALKLVNGEYICFADNDDRMPLNSLECLYNEASKNNLDILEARFQKMDFLGKPGKIHPENIKLTNNPINGIDYIKSYRELISTTLWDKLWKTSFIKKNNIMNGEDMQGAEDVMFTVDAFLKAKSIKNIDFINYFHREHLSAASNKTDSIHVGGRIRMIEYLEKKNAEFKSGGNQNLLTKEIVLHLTFTLRAIKKYPSNDEFRQLSAKKLEFFIKKYKEEIQKSDYYKKKEKILLCISIHFFLFYYDVKRLLT